MFKNSSKNTCIQSLEKLLKTICSVIFFPVQMREIPVLKTFSKKKCPSCIDNELEFVLFEHVPLNLWGYNYIKIREIRYNKNDETAYYDA